MESLRPGADKIQADQLASVASTFLKLRPKLLAPIAPLLLFLLLRAAIPRPQLLVLGLNFLLMLSFFTWEAWRVRARPTGPRAFARSLKLTLIGLALLAGFSGGPASPFLPVLFAPVGIAFAAFGRERQTREVLVVLSAALLYVGVSGQFIAWPPIPAPEVHIMLMGATLLSTVLLFFGVTGLATAYRRTAQRLEGMRLDVIGNAARRSSDMESVGARVAHEIKNPLASIKGLVQLMFDAAPTTSQAPAGNERLKLRLGVVLNEVSRVEQVLADYLSFSRPLADLKRRRRRLDLFLEELCELLGGQAQDSGVEIELTCPQLSTEFDPDQLKQALLNLTQNALLAMPGGGRLALRVRQEVNGFEIAISDTGAGISKLDLPRLKEPYFSRREGGTGLGIVIANAIVEQHQGQLSFSSEPGVGTTALIRLPHEVNS